MIKYMFKWRSTMVYCSCISCEDHYCWEVISLASLVISKKEKISISQRFIKSFNFAFLLRFLFICLFLERGEGKEKEWEKNINVWLPLTHSPLGTWPATQACAQTGNRTSDPLVRRPVLNPLEPHQPGLGLLNHNELQRVCLKDTKSISKAIIY